MMKKRSLLLIVLLISFGFSSYSQVNLGLKAGANLGKIDGTAYKDQFNLGYQLGGFLTVNLTENLAIQPEVLFNQTNTKLTNAYSEIWDSKFDKGKTLNYVNVPVLLKFNPQGFISLLAGPQFSFLTNKDENVVQNGKKLFKNADFSFVAGAEFNIVKSLSVYARYVWGFADISNFGGKANSQQIQLGVGLKLF